MSKDFIEFYSKSVRTPYEAQRLLHSFEYNTEPEGETLKSANEALRIKKSHCLEACFIVSSLLEKHGYEPLVLSLESVDYLDHVVYLFKHGEKWGAVGHSRDEGLHGRKAVFDTPKEVAESFIDDYVDKTARIKAYAVVSLNDCKADWRYSTRNVWSVEKYLIDYPHKPIYCSNARYKKLHARYMSGMKPEKKSYWL